MTVGTFWNFALYSPYGQRHFAPDSPYTKSSSMPTSYFALGTLVISDFIFYFFVVVFYEFWMGFAVRDRGMLSTRFETSLFSAFSLLQAGFIFFLRTVGLRSLVQNRQSRMMSLAVEGIDPSRKTRNTKRFRR
jgi:hypothetical protein